MERKKFELSQTYWNPYHPPGRAPEGTKWRCIRIHPEKGYPEEWQLRKVGVENNQPPTIDELPPTGVAGLLSKTPPRTMGGVTPEQLERSVKKGGPRTYTAWVSEALEEKEDD